jgi:hypothetical protein
MIPTFQNQTQSLTFWHGQPQHNRCVKELCMERALCLKPTIVAIKVLKEL